MDDPKTRLTTETMANDQNSNNSTTVQSEKRSGLARFFSRKKRSDSQVDASEIELEELAPATVEEGLDLSLIHI